MPKRARHITRMTIDDAAHYTAEQREEIVASYLEHERDARPPVENSNIFGFVWQKCAPVCAGTPTALSAC